MAFIDDLLCLRDSAKQFQALSSGSLLQFWEVCGAEWMGTEGRWLEDVPS